jgi:pyruvate/2-oxoglutarate dehydrogenase complex dihydrolipoamide dehydrogenase (E3) component
LGGQLQLASIPPGKKDIIPFTTYLSNQIRKSNVRVKLGQTLTAALLDETKPDAAILATGSKPIIPTIPGISSRNTVTGRDVLRGAKVPGKKVVIIGGGQVGCEVAEFLGEQGKEITVIELLASIAREMPHINRIPLEFALEKHKVRIMTKTKVLSITDEGVMVECVGKKELIPTDEIVIAVGAEPVADGIDELVKGTVPEVYRIGDKVKAQGILEAVRDGFEVAKKI